MYQLFRVYKFKDLYLLFLKISFSFSLRLFDWRPDKPLETTRLRFERIVILKNMFDPKEFTVSHFIVKHAYIIFK